MTLTVVHCGKQMRSAAAQEPWYLRKVDTEDEGEEQHKISFGRDNRFGSKGAGLEESKNI